MFKFRKIKIYEKFSLIGRWLFFSVTVLFGLHGQTIPKNDKIPLAPPEWRRPVNFQPFEYKYSLEELKDNFSDEIMQKARQQYKKMESVNEKGKWKPTLASIDSHMTPEWFNDAKFGMFIDWGLWSIPAWAPKNEYGGGMYPDWYEYRMYTDSVFIKYHEKNWGKDFERDDFIPLFNTNIMSLIN